MKLLLSIATALAAIVRNDSVTTEVLPDGFVRVKTKQYSVEVPKEWTVGNQTPWGARSITNGKDHKTELGIMTAGVTTKTWDELYQTSMFFIMSEEKGKATPYKLSKTDSGYDACSFQVLDSQGFAKRRYVLLKSPNGAAIALSVRIANQSEAPKMEKFFDRLIKSARIYNP